MEDGNKGNIYMNLHVKDGPRLNVSFSKANGYKRAL